MEAVFSWRSADHSWRIIKPLVYKQLRLYRLVFLSCLALYLVEVTEVASVSYCSKEPFDCASSMQPHISASSLPQSSWQSLPNKCRTIRSSSKCIEGRMTEGRRALYRTVPGTQMGKKRFPPILARLHECTDSANTDLPLEISSSHQSHRLGQSASTNCLFWRCLDNSCAQDYQPPPPFTNPRYILYLKEALTLHVLRANTYELLQTVKAKATNSHQEARNSFMAVKLCRARNMPAAMWADHTAQQILMFSLPYVTYFRAFVQTARRQEKHTITGGKLNIPFSRQTVGAWALGCLQ